MEKNSQTNDDHKSNKTYDLTPLNRDRLRAIELILEKDGKFSMSIHKTASETYRILINGKVHPLFVGFASYEAAYKTKAVFTFMGQIQI